jgi:CheY-like chemotaxis protein
VKLMDGSVSVESIEGRGSRFSAFLPFERVAAKPEAETIAELSAFDAGAYRILVAEDEAINRMYLTTYLTSSGYEVLEAADGARALERARGERPHLLLLDISMPVKDGWTVAAELRCDPSFDDMLIIALTAHAQDDVRRRCTDLGMNGFLTKPIDEKLMEATLRELLGKNHDPEGSG